MAIEWTKEWALGNDEIDEQHKTLVRQVNELMEAMKAAQGKQSVERTLSFLEEYTVLHFGTEEALMAQHRYPALAAHRLLHQAFVQDFKKLAEELSRTGPTSALAIAVNARVGQWLVTHVLSSDQAFGQYLRGRETS